MLQTVPLKLGKMTEAEMGECRGENLVKFPGGCRHSPGETVPQISSA